MAQNKYYPGFPDTKRDHRLLPEAADVGDNSLIELLDELCSGIDEVVRKGAEVINWGGHRVYDRIHLHPALLMLRRIVQFADAIGAQLRGLCVEPTNATLRILVESYFALSYLLQQDQERRGCAYLLCDCLEHIRMINQLLQSNAALAPTLRDQLEKAIVKLNADINGPILKSAFDEYSAIKENIKGLPKWHTLFGGPRTIEEMARRLNLHNVYETSYRAGSQSIHGTTAMQGIAQTGSGAFGIEPIRWPFGSESVVYQAMRIAVGSYKVFAESVLPDREVELKAWYFGLRGFVDAVEKEELISWPERAGGKSIQKAKNADAEQNAI